ncbi:hypothetical protein HKD42_02760 [Altererythrobacter sp. RZ02]|uniref:SecDF P1 head subdomain domain-containing protein n=1 Tax=Pontixanthobacter rizhaonensis TaxID=2730337 RepID=A0A848QJM5_9SPHN|nr:hypothetical protein [Pontixanthobacter rizhaonensis]NMW30980.1 hypothetical protein [Pontixanthobacter rizhaonensis]
MNRAVRAMIALVAAAFSPVAGNAQQADQAPQANGAAESAKKGVFVGSLQLCADTVETASARPEEYTGQMVVSIILRPASTQTFSEMTNEFVGKPLPITLDGEVVISPTVYEPIFGGAIAISGVTVAQQSRLVAAFTQPC